MVFKAKINVRKISIFTNLQRFNFNRKQDLKIASFWENPKIAHLIFVLEMRTFNFRFEKHLIFHLIFTELSSRMNGRPQAQIAPR